jgi:hypothetical protein
MGISSRDADGGGENAPFTGNLSPGQQPQSRKSKSAWQKAIAPITHQRSHMYDYLGIGFLVAVHHGLLEEKNS